MKQGTTSSLSTQYPFNAPAHQCLVWGQSKNLIFHCLHLTGRHPREDLKTHILVPLSVYAFMLFNQSWNLWSAWQTVCFSNPLSPLSVHAAFNLIFFKPTLLWLNLNSQPVVLTRTVLRACLVAQMGKNPPAMWETWIWSLSWEDPLEEGMATHQCSCLENPHGQRSLVGYSPWGSKKSDVTEAA